MIADAVREIVLSHPDKRAVAQCCIFIAWLSFAPLMSFTQTPPTLASPPDANDFGVTPAQQHPEPNLSDKIIDGYIEGTVIDPQGKPVEGAYVYSVGNEEGKLPLGGRWPPGPIATTDAEGRFVLFHVLPDNPVSVYASKPSDYYADNGGLSLFLVPNAKPAEVEVKLGQPVNVTIQLGPKVGRIQFYVRDADSKELVHGIFMQTCRKGTPAKYCEGGMSGPSDYTTLISPGLGFL